MIRELFVLPEIFVGVFITYGIELLVALTFWFGSWKGFYVVEKERENIVEKQKMKTLSPV